MIKLNMGVGEVTQPGMSQSLVISSLQGVSDSMDTILSQLPDYNPDNTYAFFTIKSSDPASLAAAFETVFPLIKSSAEEISPAIAQLVETELVQVVPLADQVLIAVNLHGLRSTGAIVEGAEHVARSLLEGTNIEFRVTLAGAARVDQLLVGESDQPIDRELLAGRASVEFDCAKSGLDHLRMIIEQESNMSQHRLGRLFIAMFKGLSVDLQLSQDTSKLGPVEENINGFRDIFLRDIVSALRNMLGMTEQFPFLGDFFNALSDHAIAELSIGVSSGFLGARAEFNFGGFQAFWESLQ